MVWVLPNGLSFYLVAPRTLNGHSRPGPTAPPRGRRRHARRVLRGRQPRADHTGRDLVSHRDAVRRLADHHDPVTTNHLPGGEPESAVKTRTARLRRST